MAENEKMEEEKRKEREKKFEEYFKNNFVIERGDLYDKYNDRKIDLSYNYEEAKYTTPENVYSVIKEAFENGKGEEMELFLRKLDLLAKDKVDLTNVTLNGALFGDEKYIDSNYINKRSQEIATFDGKYVIGYNTTNIQGLESDSINELINNKDNVSKINFKNVTNLINTMSPNELYAVMNSDLGNFTTMRVERAADYIRLEDSMDKIKKQERDLEIFALQRFVDRNGYLTFNKTFIDELVADIIRYGAKDTLRAYLLPLKVLPKALIWGPGSPIDTARFIAKKHMEHRREKMLKTEPEYQFEYKTFEKMLKRNYYHSELDELKQEDIKRKQIKADNLGNLIDMVEFNSQDYLKEYKTIMPFLKKHRLRKKSQLEMNLFLRNIDRVFSDVERQLERPLSDITKELIRNELVLNTFIENKLLDKEYIVIDNIESKWFGLKVPITNGKVDEEIMLDAFRVLGTEDSDKLLEAVKLEVGKKRKTLKQMSTISPNEEGNIDLGEGLEENHFFVANFIKKELFQLNEDISEEEQEEIDNLTKEILGEEAEKDVFSTQSLEVEFEGQVYDCNTKLDARIISILNEKIKEPETREKIKEGIEKFAGEIEGKKYTYSYVFEDLYENITSNPNFKLNSHDLQVLNSKCEEIERDLRHHVSIDTIMEGLVNSVEDYKKVDYILRIFEKNYNINDIGVEYGENPNVKRNARTKHDRFSQEGSSERQRIYSQLNKNNGTKDEGEVEATNVQEVKSALKNVSGETTKNVAMVSAELKLNQEFLEKMQKTNLEKIKQNLRDVELGNSKINIVEETKENPEQLAFNTYTKDDLKDIEKIGEFIENKENKKEIEKFREEFASTNFLNQEVKSLVLQTEELKYQLDRLGPEKYKLELFSKNQKVPFATLDLTINPKISKEEKNKMLYLLDNFKDLDGTQKAIVVARAIENVDINKLKAVLKAEKNEKIRQLSSEFLNEKPEKISEKTKEVFRYARKDWKDKKYKNNEIKEMNKISEEIIKILEKLEKGEKLTEKDGFSKEILEKINNKELKLKILSDEIARKLKIEKNPLADILNNIKLKNNKKENVNSKKINEIKEINEEKEKSKNNEKEKNEINKNSATENLEKESREKEKNVLNKEERKNEQEKLENENNKKRFIDTTTDGTVKAALEDKKHWEAHNKKVSHKEIKEKNLEKLKGTLKKVEEEQKEVEKELKDDISEISREEQIETSVENDKKASETESENEYNEDMELIEEIRKNQKQITATEEIIRKSMEYDEETKKEEISEENKEEAESKDIIEEDRKEDQSNKNKEEQQKETNEVKKEEEEKIKGNIKRGAVR